MTVTFSPGIQGLTFKLLNVDKGATSGSANTFVDQVTVSGKYNTTSVTPTISASGTAGTYSTISGNVITGTGDAPSSSADPGNKVTFAGTVTEVTITYCNDAANTAANPGTQTITVEDFSWTATTPLPVQLLSFQGKPIGNQVALLWETAWEQNSDYFEVQRSRDAKEFVSIGRVAALDESKSRHSYSLLDQNPVAGTGYYRLKQVDKGEQQTTYSKMIAIVLDDITLP
ncbi:hypothetical protein GO730_34910 [Spirosoma sp. HMF3257]|uniref:Uncharacterized protein n=1 Tax=Spirosoma telluris TaxID=2183553 RepID=A0A327NRJ8_9BACT|nr:hypothetical protein [Spirosoma telluris]RAI77980.1 hypothetical protein HMF3257_34810 [Spirosoma telluris]